MRPIPLNHFSNHLKILTVWLFILGILAAGTTPAGANPFTRKNTAEPVQERPADPARADRTAAPQLPAAQPVQPPAPKLSPADPPPSPGFLLRITMWQQQIKQKMTAWIREAKTTGRIAPLLWVLGSALVYGMVHSAGPGHGKAVALSYIFCFKPSLPRALAFGNVLAFSHGMSGVVLVLAVKYLFQASMTGSLDRVTRITQLTSFSLIVLLGVVLFVRNFLKWMRGPAPRAQEHGREDECAALPEPGSGRPPLLSAVAMGMIPCPGVVLAMLFSLSMGLPLFGVLLGLSISLGMALTLTLIVVAGVLGKSALLSAAARFLPGDSGTAERLEAAVEAMAGILVAIFGGLFLAAAL
ncbi:MAG: hypothetical protein V6Z89_11335 [Desulfobacter sp.]